MKKLFYILPEYTKNISSHFRYNVELLEEAAKEMKIFLFIEKGESPTVKNIQKVYVAKFSFLPLRFIERFFVFFMARLFGYRNFYSHYGYLSALIAAIFGRLYFWHCEMRGEYECSDCVSSNVLVDRPFRKILKKCYRLVTCTELMKEYYGFKFNVDKKKILVMPNWVDINKKLPAAKKEDAILFLHWLSPRKGSRVLPDIFEKIAAEAPKTKFIVAGEGPDFEWLKSEFKNKGLKVEMPGAVPNKDVLKLFAKVKLFINPSREEEFGRVLIEAMAAKVPLVASDTLGTKAIFSTKQKEYCFRYGDSEKAAKLCLEILASKKLQSELIKEGEKVVKNYSKEKTVEKFISLFN